MRTAQAHSPTKEKLLEAAQRLMLAKGYEATSVGEICKAAKLTKGSLFHYFKSKEDLGKAVLERFCQSMQERLQAGPFRRKRDPLERIDGMLEFMIQMSRDPVAIQGCLPGNFAQELSETHPEIRSCCAQQFQAWAEGLKRELDKARVKHAPTSPINTQSLAEHFIAVIEGSLILAKAKQDTRVIGESLRHLKRYVHSLFERG